MDQEPKRQDMDQEPKRQEPEVMPPRTPGGARSKCARNPTGQHAGKEGSHTWRELMFGQTSTDLGLASPQ